MNVKMTMVAVVRFATTLMEALNVLVLMVTSWIVMELLVQVLCACAVYEGSQILMLLSLDINECEIDTDNCDHYCYNTIGSFSCYCENGYRLHENNATCNGMSLIMESHNHNFLDINECEEGTSRCDQICTNTDGSYVCSCRSGYYLDADNHTCSGQLMILLTSLYH